MDKARLDPVRKLADLARFKARSDLAPLVQKDADLRSDLAGWSAAARNPLTLGWHTFAAQHDRLRQARLSALNIERAKLSAARAPLTAALTLAEARFAVLNRLIRREQDQARQRKGRTTGGMW